MVAVHKCTNEAEATVIINALADAGIMAIDKKWLSGLFPVPNVGPTLYVQEKDFDKALQVIIQVKKDVQHSLENESFREIDHKGIAYLKKKHGQNRFGFLAWLLIIIMVLVFLARMSNSF